MKKIMNFLVLTLVLASFSPAKVEASSNPQRIFGRDRIQTSIEVSKKAYPNTNTNAVVLAGYTGEVDSLSGTILAHVKGAPILLTRSNALTDITLKEIERLKPTEIYILGGENAISKNVENSLSKYKVTRLTGKKREETAVNIAQKAVGNNINEVFLTLGYDQYADALAIGPVSAKQNKPILLTRTGALPKDTKDALVNFKVKKATIIGGEVVISKAVENDLKKMNITVERVFGKDRFETALNISKKYIASPNAITIANGYNYADAVIGGYFAAKENAPILLSRANLIDIDSLEYIASKKMQNYILGGERVIYKGVFEDVSLAMEANVVIKDETTQIVIDSKTTQNVLDRVYYRDGVQFRRQNIRTTVVKK